MYRTICRKSKQKQQENQFSVCPCSTGAILKHELQPSTVGREEGAASYTQTYAQSDCKLQSDTTTDQETQAQVSMYYYTAIWSYINWGWWVIE